MLARFKPATVSRVSHWEKLVKLRSMPALTYLHLDTTTFLSPVIVLKVVAAMSKILSFDTGWHDPLNIYHCWFHTGYIPPDLRISCSSLSYYSFNDLFRGNFVPSTTYSTSTMSSAFPHSKLNTWLKISIISLSHKSTWFKKIKCSILSRQ